MNSEFFIMLKLPCVLWVWKSPCFNLRHFLLLVLNWFLSVFSGLPSPNTTSPSYPFSVLVISFFCRFTTRGHVGYQNFNKVFHFLFYCTSCLFCRCTLFSLYFLTYLSSVLKLLLRSSRTLHCPFPSQKETLTAVQSSTCMCCCPADFLLGTANSM